MARIGVRTSVGGMYFDAVFREEHTSEIEKTEHPVEYGVSLSDHAFIKPDVLSLEVGMTDSVVGTGGYAGRSVTAYNALRELQRSLQFLTVVTELRTYENMTIDSIVTPRDQTTTHSLKATIMLSSTNVAYTQSVAISARASSNPQKSGQTTGGTQQAASGSTATQQSILKQASSNLFGAA